MQTYHDKQNIQHMHETSARVHWEDPEGSDRERGGRGDWDGEYM